MQDRLDITPLPSGKDNYIWVARAGPHTIVVDPGEAQPVIDHLDDSHKLRAIVLTHKHDDHIGGVAELMDRFPRANIYESKYSETLFDDIVIGEGDEVRPIGLDDQTLKIHHAPGHTRDHLIYVGGGVLFSGDLLFSCGCGRLFEGDETDLANGVRILEGLDHNLEVCAGHEYTLDNIRFAKEVEPNNPALLAWERKAAKLRAEGKPTLPTTLGDEFTYNPFLRAGVDAVRQAAEKHAGEPLGTKTQVLRVLRAWKDDFK
ncbi:MAG: hydroxyacylglutathione hydrolase [Betaproteobacteria bacterium AqS2]|uniref:Hydroxyacylglutathione hydrolase n=1 Tax=Candidatus Amphirhobacter heronislandensis TaxID=1732024 RepID=A0A930UDY0_9GAMM|nr:hydroxyacylglutathione hydrolase [Betaproteobacteria bacterium AqS2]